MRPLLVFALLLLCSISDPNIARAALSGDQAVEDEPQNNDIRAVLQRDIRNIEARIQELLREGLRLQQNSASLRISSVDKYPDREAYERELMVAEQAVQQNARTAYEARMALQQLQQELREVAAVNPPEDPEI